MKDYFKKKLVDKMKDLNLKEKFIDMRMEGCSFDKIAKELNNSKITLIQWNKELKKEISNLEFLKYQGLLEKHKLTQTAKVEYLMEAIEKVKRALQEKDYNKLSVRDLVKLLEKLENDLKQETQNIKYYTGDFIKIDSTLTSLFGTEEEITIDLY